jgi:hypothetical protein
LLQNLIDAHPEITRLYTTLSAAEMTLDPLFTFNADLGDVSNQHTAVRIIECNPGIYQYQAPWRIELPQGGVLRGTAADAQSQVWPAALAVQPPNRLITRTSASGTGKVLEDNSDTIDQLLTEYNASVPAPVAISAGNGGSAGDGNGAGGVGDGNGAKDDQTPAASSVGGGCAIAPGNALSFGAIIGAALGAFLIRRRRLSST